MKTTLVAVASFVAGAAAGAFGAYYILRKRYEEYVQEEVDSVKEVFYARLREELKDEDVEDIFETEVEEEPAVEEKKDETERTRYATFYSSDAVVSNGDEPAEIYIPPIDEADDKPYPITPLEFAENDIYTRVTLTRYADGILADDENQPIEDIPGTVGADYADHIGEYEEGAAYIRNDARRCDYEILVDELDYADALGKEDPKRGEDE